MRKIILPQGCSQTTCVSQELRDGKDQRLRDIGGLAVHHSLMKEQSLRSTLLLCSTANFPPPVACFGHAKALSGSETRFDLYGFSCNSAFRTRTLIVIRPPHSSLAPVRAKRIHTNCIISFFDEITTLDPLLRPRSLVLRLEA